MRKFFFLLKQITQGYSILRAYLNYDLCDVTLRGKTIDIGSGSADSEYLSFVPQMPHTTYEQFDLKVGQTIDFERDCLPATDGEYDTVVFLNVMEHIFNYQHIASEVVRITHTQGQLIGYVPFLMWYHPDHSDYFRYTNEALDKIFKTAGAENIKIVPSYCGPFVAANQMLNLSIPRLLRPLVFSFFYLLDRIYFVIKKNEMSSRYVLGYLFIATK